MCECDSAWLRTDVGLHVLDCLENSERQLDWVVENKRAWPWVIISLASLLQATCVLYIDERETASLGALDKKSVREFYESLENDDKPWSPPRLAAPKKLIERVKTQNDNLFDDCIKNDLIRLYTERHNFMHFTPKSYSLDMVGLSRITKHTLTAVENMIADKGFYGDNRLQKNARERALLICQNRLKWLEENMDTSK